MTSSSREHRRGTVVHDLGVAVTAEEYFELATACDRLLRMPGATLEWVAIPELHVLNAHPAHAPTHAAFLDADIARRGVGDALATAGRYASLAKILSRSAARGWNGADPVWSQNSIGRTDSCRVDVVLVSILVNPSHLDVEDDFYFGGLQRILAEAGRSSLLLLRNASGRPNGELLSRAGRDGPRARMLLPDVLPMRDELGFIARCLRARRALSAAARHAEAPLDRTIALRAAQRVVSPGVVHNLRLHASVARVCRALQPSVVMALYEGHASERCVWHGARTGGRHVLCVAYQHTVLWAHSHAVKRSLGRGRGFDPDVILTAGDVARGVLEASPELGAIPVMVLGTHRRVGDETRAGGDGAVAPAVLVAPDGIESECVYLFEFALECARRLPDVRFILRTHPILPFEQVAPKLRGYAPPPANVEISRGRPIEEDFVRAGCLLYRGSSTVVHAVLAGLKPFYVARAGEMDLDPLYELLSNWREHVSSVEDLVARYAGWQERRDEERSAEWRLARSFCERYFQPVTAEAVHHILERASIARRQDAGTVIPPGSSERMRAR